MFKSMSTILASCVLTAVVVLSGGSVAQAYPTGCRILSPWTAYQASWNPAVMTTNRFIAQGCNNSTTVTDLDVTRVLSAGSVPQCVYMRVELFYSDGRSAGAFSENGPWTWQMVCDQMEFQPILEGVVEGTKYDVQVTGLDMNTPPPVWLGYFRD